MQPTIFDTDDNPRSPSAPISLSQHGPLPTRGQTVARALYLSRVPDQVDLSPLYIGARLLGLRRVGPQQVELAARILAETCGAPVFDELAVLEPRRAAKTTTIWACMIGLCASRPGFKVVITAQTYVKARERFLEVARELQARNIGDYRILRGAAAESIEWTNGSRLWMVTPEGSAFRGDGANAIVFDESQEHGPDKTADLLAGALALMDTKFDDDADLSDPDARPDGQVIYAGTTGTSRSGMLWDALERGRAGHIGIVEYAIPDHIPVAYDVATPEGAAGVAAGWTVHKGHVLNEPALLDAHPGIGTLTSLGVIRSRFQAMELDRFAREYGGQWPHDAGTRAIDPEDWAAGLVTEYPPKPDRYCLGYDVAPDQSAAALVAAWRDDEGRPWLEVIEHRAGDAWLAPAVHKITGREPNLRVGYDNIGPNQAVADRLIRESRPRRRLHSLGTREITAGSAQLAQEIGRRQLHHVEDPALDDAAEIAVRRSIGDGSWAWGRRKSGDIAALVAGTAALKLYDMETRPSARVRIITPTAA